MKIPGHIKALGIYLCLVIPPMWLTKSFVEMYEREDERQKREEKGKGG